MASVLVVGISRSGTTWLSDVLGSVPGARTVSEPDSTGVDGFAWVGKRHLGFQPTLKPGDEATPHYELMWEVAFGGGWPHNAVVTRLRREALRLPREAAVRSLLVLARASHATRRRPRHVVVKTVQSIPALEWITDRYAVRVIVVRRNLLAVLSSWLERGWGPNALDRDDRIIRRWAEPLGIAPPPPGASEMHRIVWGIGMLAAILADCCPRHPDWQVVDYESAIASPSEVLARLAGAAGLDWTAASEEYLAANLPGSARAQYRDAAELNSRWRRRLGDDTVATAREVLSGFPLGGWALDAVPGAAGTAAAGSEPPPTVR